MLLEFVGMCCLAAIFGSVLLVAAMEPTLIVPVKRPLRHRHGVTIRPESRHVRPIGAPERVAFPRRTPSGRGSL